MNLLPLSSFVNCPTLTKLFRSHVEGSHNLASQICAARMVVENIGPDLRMC